MNRIAMKHGGRILRNVSQDRSFLFPAANEVSDPASEADPVLLFFLCA